MKTQLGEETNMANWMSSAMGCCVLPETKVPGQRDCTGLGDQSRRRPPEADESSLCTVIRQPSGKTALFLSHTIQLVLFGVQCQITCNRSGPLREAKAENVPYRLETLPTVEAKLLACTRLVH